MTPSPRHAADLSRVDDARRAVAGTEVVVMAAPPPYPRWVDEWPHLVDTVVDATAAAGARLVFVDNLYMYAPAGGPIDEASPEHASDPKGALRRRLGEALLRAHATGRVPVAIGRFSDYYGPGGTNSSLYITGIAPALRGRTMRGLVDLDQPHTYSYLPDAARAFAALVEDPRADGRAWILPAAPPITQRDLLGLINRQLPAAVRVSALSPLMLRLAAPSDPMIRETRSVTVQFDRPWVVDATRFTSTFGPFATTSHAQAVATTVAWFRAEGSPAR